jgi:hypothetical protein
MIISLDNLAQRYHLLPSEALGRASSFDLYVLNISTLWHNYKQEEAENKSKGLAAPSPKLTQQQMQAMLDNVRKNNK